MPSRHNPLAFDTPELPSDEDVARRTTGTAGASADGLQQTLRLHLHRPGHTIELVEITDAATRLRDVVAVEEDDLIFVDDDDEPVDPDRAVAEVIAGRGRHHRHHHIHTHPCRWIDTQVTYRGATRRFDAAPSSRVETVRLRAEEAFGIDPAEEAALTLQLAGSAEDAPDGDYLSDFAGRETCGLDLELVPSGSRSS
jgi:hypothetical protein